MNYNHFNRALNKRIHTKKEYFDEMKKQGMVPAKEAKQMVTDYKERTHKSYDKPSDKTLTLIRGFKSKIPDQNGKIRLSGREIDAMKEVGVRFDVKIRRT